MRYLVIKGIDEQMALKNVIGLGKLNKELGEYCKSNNNFYFKVNYYQNIASKQVSMATVQRLIANTSIGSQIELKPFTPDKEAVIKQLIIETEYMVKNNEKQNFLVHDADKMIEDVHEKMKFQVLKEGQKFLVESLGEMVLFKVIQIIHENEKVNLDYGILTKNTQILFIGSNYGSLKLKSESKALIRSNQIINPDFKFDDLGIGGLDSEFSVIFRRAFASRLYPLDLVEKLGISHVKGIILYGPPGTGKTLIARKIGKMLNAKNPKIVNGPEILNKYVGQSEENIRNLFYEAEEDFKKMGDQSPLHIIIFDEIDAICKRRNNRGDSTGTGDSIVNQLLAKIDGVDQLNNILVIGMTNRIDMIDNALLRPGRFEVQLEIGLPDQKGRLDILKIHTKKMRVNSILAPDVDLEYLSKKTINFSGAELEGLIKSATSFSFNRKIKVDQIASINEDAIKDFKVTKEDFEISLDEIKPMYGPDESLLRERMENGFISYSEKNEKIIKRMSLLVSQLKNNKYTHSMCTIIYGEPRTGKTSLAVKVAIDSKIPFIKIIDNYYFVGDDEYSKSQRLSKYFDDAYKSEISLIILDDLENLVNYSPLGQRFSNHMLQTVITLCKKKPVKERKIYIILITSSIDFFIANGLTSICTEHINVEKINLCDDIDSIAKIIESTNILNDSQMEDWRKKYIENITLNGLEEKYMGIKKIYQILRRIEEDNNSLDKIEAIINSLLYDDEL